MKKIDERGDSWEGSVLQLRRPKYNKRFYQEHKDKAEKFVYSPLPWTSMVVADIIQSRDNPGKPMARLVGADGSVSNVNPSLLCDEILKLDPGAYYVITRQQLLTKDMEVFA